MGQEYKFVLNFLGNHHGIPHSVFFNGTFYMLDPRKGIILGVEVDKGEIYCRIKLPRRRRNQHTFSLQFFLPTPGSPQDKCIRQSKGYLHCLMENENDIKVGILKDYNGHDHWALKHSIRIKALI